MRSAALALALIVTVGCDDADHHVGDAGHDDDAGHADDEDMPHVDVDVDDAGAHDFGLPEDALPTVTGPFRLSDTGLYSDFTARTLAPGVMAFTPRYQLWSDGAEKQRYLLLPPGAVIDTTDLDRWVFPVGTKVWKEFRKDGKLVETRLQYKVESGSRGWWMMSYGWNDAGTEADALPHGRDNTRGTTHRIPSQEDCTLCHLMVTDSLIGVSAMQLAGGSQPSPLARLVAEGRLSAPPPVEPEVPGSGVVKEALGYLHGNCGHCHNDDNFLSVQRTLRFRLLVGAATPEQTPAYQTAFNTKAFHKIGGADRIVVPGKPAESQAWIRMGLRDFDAMPPVCSKELDTVGMQTIEDWIRALPP